MTIQQRVEQAILPKFDSALGFLQDELADVGFSSIDIGGLVEALKDHATKKFADVDEAEEEDVLLKFGEEGQPVPNALARLMACLYLSGWLERLEEAVSEIQDTERKKLLLWAKEKTRTQVSIDMKTLSVSEYDETEDVCEFLEIGYMVLHYEEERLQNILAGFEAKGGPQNGTQAFIKDLILARFSDARVESVMLDMLQVTSGEVIDKILGNEVLKENENFKAIAFLGSKLKKAIDLEIPAEDWQTLDDDTAEDESEGA